MKTKRAVERFYFSKAWAVYFACLLLGLNIKLTQGLYLFDIVVFASVIVSFPRVMIKRDSAFAIVAGVFVSFLSIMLNPELVSFSSFYVPWNIFIFLSYQAFLGSQKDIVTKLNYDLVVLFLMLPIVVSCFMFLSPALEVLVTNFYDLSIYPAFGRYGGAFGKDVNALGLISSVLILFVLVLLKFDAVSRIVVALAFFFCLFGVILSGMRSGLLVLLGTLILFNWKLKLVEKKHVILGSIATIFFFLAAFWYIFDSDLVSYISSRFSMTNLVRDFSAGRDGGNLRVAIDYFYRTLDNVEITAYKALFGIDSSLNYVDNLYVFLFVKHGIIALLVFSLILAYFMINTLLISNYFLLALIVFSAILSIKGIFVLSNTYMFITTLMHIFWNSKSTKPQRVFPLNHGDGFGQVAFSPDLGPR